jgi:hypothetical protein
MRGASSSGSWVSSQQLVEPDRQVADPDPGGVVHRAGDRGGRADDAHLADPLGPGGPEVRLLLVDPHRVDVLQVADNPEQTLVYFTTDEVPAAKLAALAAEVG